MTIGEQLQKQSCYGLPRQMWPAQSKSLRYPERLCTFLMDSSLAELVSISVQS
jgi:hypothetical protein